MGAPPTAEPGLRVLVAAGGTVGHVAPALQVAAELREHGHDVTWIGSAGRAEEELVPAAGYELEIMPVTWLPRRPGRGQVDAAVRAGRSVAVARRVMRRIRPHVLFTGGGYVILPAKLAARTLRVPFVASEADAHLGLANRLGIRRAARLCTAFSLPQLPLRQEVTGRPVDPAFAARTRAAGRAALDLPQDVPVVAVVGGSGGARNLSRAAIEAWAPGRGDWHGLTNDTVVLHVTGRRDWEQFRDAGDDARYRCMDYCTDMPSLLAAADVVVSRAGASIFELAAAGVPAVLVPWADAAGDHQRANAEWFAAHDAALVARDDADLAASLRAAVGRLLGADGAAERERLSAGMRGLARPGAAERIADIVEQVGDARRTRGVDVMSSEARA